MSRHAVEVTPLVEAAPEVEAVDAAAPVGDVADSAVLLGANDPVVMGQPNLSVVGAGRVVISAAATVTFVIATPLLVFTHKHMGDLRGM
jgi:hypothetical protein